MHRSKLASYPWFMYSLMYYIHLFILNLVHLSVWYFLWPSYILPSRNHVLMSLVKIVCRIIHTYIHTYFYILKKNKEEFPLWLRNSSSSFLDSTLTLKWQFVDVSQLEDQINILECISFILFFKVLLRSCSLHPSQTLVSRALCPNSHAFHWKQIILFKHRPQWRSWGTDPGSPEWLKKVFCKVVFPCPQRLLT